MNVPNITPVPATPVAEPTLPTNLRLIPVLAPLAGLVIKGLLLTIVTLGFYRFWYKTALRRYYWNNTTLAGDGFEYTGTGKELFVGFLIGIAIVLPLYFAVTLVSIFGGALLGPILAAVLTSGIAPAVFLMLAYRGRRYRLARTRYYGVRFHQTGSGMGYLLRTVKWLILTALTLGILVPYLRRALERYKIENTWYGSAQGSFAAPVKPLMKIWLVLWSGALLVVFLSIGAPILYSSGMTALGGALTALLPFLGLALWGVWVHYRVCEFRLFLAGTQFAGITLESDLRTRSVIWAQVRYGLILLAIVAVPIGLSVMTAIKAQFSPAMGSGLETFLTGPLGGTLSALLAFGAFVLFALVTEILLRRRLWQLRAQSVTVGNLGALDRIIQQAGSETGGVGDAFDTGFDVAG